SWGESSGRGCCENDALRRPSYEDPFLDDRVFSPPQEVTTYLRDQTLELSNPHSPIANTQHRLTISTINSVLERTTTESRQHFSSFITLNAKGCCVLAIGECGLLKFRSWSLKYVVTLARRGKAPSFPSRWAAPTVRRPSAAPEGFPAPWLSGSN